MADLQSAALATWLRRLILKSYCNCVDEVKAARKTERSCDASDSHENECVGHPRPWLWLSAASRKFLMMFSPNFEQWVWFDRLFLAMICRK